MSTIVQPALSITLQEFHQPAGIIRQDAVHPQINVLLPFRLAIRCPGENFQTGGMELLHPLSCYIVCPEHQVRSFVLPRYAQVIGFELPGIEQT